MEKVVIAGYSSTCMGLASFLASWLAEDTQKFSFELRATGSSKVMLDMMKASDCEKGADIALFTLPDSFFETTDTTGIKLEPTASFAYVAIASEELFQGKNSVEASWFYGRELVTYGGGLSSTNTIPGFSLAPGQIVHRVPDTLTINEVVKSGVAVGLAVGRTEPYEIAPGFRAVPVGPSSSATQWKSYVAIRESCFNQNGIVRQVFDQLLTFDRSESPDWLIANPGFGLHPYHQQLLKTLSKRFKATEIEIVRQALDLYNLAVTEMTKNRLLTVIDAQASASYPIELKLMTSEQLDPVEESSA